MSSAKKRRPDGRSKRRPGLEEQRRILVDAAVRLFVQHGTRAVSVSQICKEANVSRDTYYRCFEDKNALIGNIWERAANTHIETFIFDDLPEGGPFDDWIAAAIDHLYDALFEEHALAHFIFVEYGDPGSPARAAIDAMYDAYVHKLQAFFDATYGVRPDALFLKAVMASAQWTVLETLRTGLTDESIARAKSATIQLTTSVFNALIETE